MEQASELNALVIWFHGHGDRGDGCKHLELQPGAAMPWIRWSFPDAPVGRVSCKKCKHVPSWFDWCACDNEPSWFDVCPGSEEAVDMVHSMIADAEKEGIPPSRVVLGGCSEGATLALLAGLTICGQESLAGIFTYCGWKAGTGRWTSQKRTNILMCHGTADTVVPCSIGRRSAEMLQKVGYFALEFSEQEGLGHHMSSESAAALRAFLERQLPRLGSSGQRGSLQPAEIELDSLD